MWLQLRQVLKKFTVSFAYCAHFDVIENRKTLNSFEAHADYLSFRHQRVCNGKTIGSHLKISYTLWFNQFSLQTKDSKNKNSHSIL